MHNKTSTTDERLARIEQLIETLSTATTTAAQHQQTVNDDLYGKFDNSLKTNWSVIIAAIGVISAIMFSLGAALINPINAQLETHDKQINIQVIKERADFEQLIRHDEQLKRIADERYLEK